MKLERFLVALSLVGFIDAISYMIVTPSIIFYVLESGGNKEQYGLIMSAFSFASFCTKPFLGHWSDTHGFRTPYVVSLSVSALGGMIYFVASSAHGFPAVAMIFLGRLLGGVGSASATLAFGYMARAVPHDKQTQTNSSLSMVRVLGMASGPGFNVLLSQVNTKLFGLPINNLNAVGLLLLVANLFAVTTIYLLLDEPTVDYSVHHDRKGKANQTEKGWKTIAKSLFCLEICVPIVSIFAFNANFQLIETAFAPAAYHALGWGPVQTSAVLGSISILILCMMLVVFELSRYKIEDEYILTFGLVMSICGYTLIWLLWVSEAQPWQFIVPIIIGVSAFPFLAAPTRSIFTKAVDNIELLDGHQGTMQAVLSMAASVAGFTAPSLVAAFVLTHSTTTASTPGQRELSNYALFAPVLSGVVLIGILVAKCKKKASFAANSREVPVGEGTRLLGSETLDQTIPSKFHPRIQIHRHDSARCMGISQGNTHAEHHGHDNH